MFGSKYLYLALGCAAIVGAAYFYYKDTQSRISKLTTELVTLDVALKSSQTIIDSMQKAKVQQEKINGELSKTTTAADVQAADFQSVVIKHDLTYLALHKPTLIEDRMNAATKKLFTGLEQFTASK